MYNLIDGKKVAADVLDKVAHEAQELKSQGKEVTLAVIIVGDDPASRVYVNHKRKDCEKVGIRSLEYALAEDTKQEELMALINELNGREDVDGILCQLPIPKHLDEKAVLKAISPAKDVDAFHPTNVGYIMLGDYTFLPCTPAGVMELLYAYDIPIEGKHCVVVGRSNIVGKPMSMLMLKENATVTVCHSRTRDLASITKQADILVAAVGRAKFITADMVKEGAVVIDVGMNRDEEGKLCGDVDFDSVAPKSSAITPVPGGVGPMTRAMLLENTIRAAT
ncbi:MAG: bifunctional methylenetetrahydrofolate dehydrogenase/methenyltetrahydrofolate cyclohydrolase FolD [Clostridiales bacterium]|jgi:methylenetetrahydrofolate dehydrogenase (NADP+)/methenyltetrahydrofolate cyclohydrolase|nr:bifunctional methylenetetrahydrofolate dehydrogenase/methenyltetrahydrofolate cyclohydrolase FolD [Clostridiales bacterium]